MNPVIVVGLGNPGTFYRSTRHNLGFMVIDEICEESLISLRWGSGEFLLGQRYNDDRTLIVAKPMTYMNLSGGAVSTLLNDVRCLPDNLLVVVDDLDLPLGKIRLRKRGSHGGHNGLRSIIDDLGTDAFARLRMGIHPGKEIDDFAEFVLSPFESSEQEKAESMIHLAVEAVNDCVRLNFSELMNKYNN